MSYGGSTMFVEELRWSSWTLWMLAIAILAILRVSWLG
jgi:hypothetical protein